MIRLLVGDVREHWYVWFGVLAVATAFGYMGGWFASFSATAAADPMVSTSFFFRSAAQAILMFSAISGCVVLSSTARGSVVSLRRTYALWQVINIPPVVVGFAVIVQIALVGVVGSCLGLALCWVSSSTVFSALFMGVDLFEGVRILPGFSSALRFWVCRYSCRYSAGREPQGRRRVRRP